MTLLRLFILMSLTGSAQSAHQRFEVYSGEHLDDIISSTDGKGTVTISTVLFVYNKQCKAEMFVSDSLYISLPLTKYILFLEHDHSTAQSHTWYDLNGDDLRLRYYIRSCLKLLYLQKGNHKVPQTDFWNPDSGISINDWVWDKILSRVVIENKRIHPVWISFTTGSMKSGPPPPNAEIVNPGESRNYLIHRSYIVLARGVDYVEFLGAWLVDNHLKKIDIVHEYVKTDLIETAWLRKLTEKDDSEDGAARELIWGSQTRHLVNLKQPLVLPNFTQLGYQKRRIPSEMYKILIDFYRAHSEIRLQEEPFRGDDVINHKDVGTAMIFLTEAIQEKVAEGLLNITEQWCGCGLEMKAFYGIREYYKGSVLRCHVDKVNTHVISAILQIDQDLAGEEDWLLEVIGWDGNRQRIALKAGEMLLYESAKLIHGRPEPFKGRVYANAFLHYKPKTGWSDYELKNMTIHYKGQKEELLPLDTDLTTRYARRRMRVISTSSKDEL